MRFWRINIMIFMICFIYHLDAIEAKEYDFEFDVKKSKVTDKSGDRISDSEAYVNSWRIGMQASLLPDFLKGTGEIAYDGLDENSSVSFSDLGRYLLIVGASGKRNALGYGLNFYSVGKQHAGKFNSKYKKNKGRTGYESWLSWDFNKLLIKTTYLESWTSNPSITNDTNTLERWYEVETSYPLSSSPLTEVSAAYAVGQRNRLFIPDGIKTYDGPLHSLKTKFDFSAQHFNFSSGFNQSSSRNDLDEHKSFQQEMIYIDGTLFPKYPLSIASSYRYSVNKHTSNSYYYKLNKMESSLGLIYKPMEIPAQMKLTSAYKNYQSTDNLTYRDIVNLGARVDWKLRERNTGLKTNWTVDLQYKDITDYVNPSHDASYWSFNLSWRWPFS